MDKDFMEKLERQKLMDSIQKAAFPEFASDIPASLMYTIEDVTNEVCRDKKVIRSYIFQAADSILHGGELPDQLREYIGTALWKIGFEDADANRAFGLEKGGKRKADKVDESKIALKVLYWANQGMPVTTVFEKVGALPDVNKSGEQVRKIYYKHKDSLENELLSGCP